ncbi:MAG: transposase [Thermoprotei archaeon]
MNIHARNKESIKKTIILASTTNSYIEGTASLLKLCGQTIRNNLKQQDPDNILKHNEEIIKTMKNMNAFKKPVIIAIDWHDIMYYGNPKTEGVKGTKTKKGTNWAYQFATAAVVVDDRKLTIAVTPVAPHESIVEHVKRLLSKIFELGIKIKLLLLDAGYYTIEVINLLNSHRIKFIMMAHDTGKFKAGDDMMYTTDSHRHLTVVFACHVKV